MGKPGDPPGQPDGELVQPVHPVRVHHLHRPNCSLYQPACGNVEMDIYGQTNKQFYIYGCNLIQRTHPFIRALSRLRPSFKKREPTFSNFLQTYNFIRFLFVLFRIIINRVIFSRVNDCFGQQKCHF